MDCKGREVRRHCWGPGDTSTELVTETTPPQHSKSHSHATPAVPPVHCLSVTPFQQSPLPLPSSHAITTVTPSTAFQSHHSSCPPPTAPAAPVTPLQRSPFHCLPPRQSRQSNGPPSTAFHCARDPWAVTAGCCVLTNLALRNTECCHITNKH